MSMTPTVEIDPTFKTALKLLHSPCPDAAEKIRNLLDEIIKSRFGGSKMLVNTLSKKVLGEESSAPGSRAVRTKSIDKKVPTPPVVEQEVEPSLAANASSIISIVEVPDDDDDDDDDNAMEIVEPETAVEDQFKEFEDLLCFVCRRMDYTEPNRLVECVECHTLYHQECHTPMISEADANDATWLCTLCKNTKSPIKVTAAPSPVKATQVNINIFF